MVLTGTLPIAAEHPNVQHCLIQTLPGCIGIPKVTHHISAKIYAHSGAPRTSQLCPKHIIFRAEIFSLLVNIIVNHVFSAGNHVCMCFLALCNVAPMYFLLIYTQNP